MGSIIVTIYGSLDPISEYHDGEYLGDVETPSPVIWQGEKEIRTHEGLTIGVDDDFFAWTKFLKVVVPCITFGGPWGDYLTSQWEKFILGPDPLFEDTGVNILQPGSTTALQPFISIERFRPPSAQVELT